ncbi:MAG TPA: alpha/beta hydrolase-fold protein, partial [Robiginitalea sp.]|nr:alpha/beta hydrolase-fold protein [Robiginitalea sp.]
MRKILYGVIALFCALPAGAQVKREIFESFKLQERRQVQYYIPEDYSPDKLYPLVIVLDGERLFDQVVTISKYYSKYQGMPEVLVVGIDQEAGDLRW